MQVLVMKPPHFCLTHLQPSFHMSSPVFLRIYVFQMREGERAILHVPPEEGYGSRSQGRQGGGW
jgi:hypothetical protein